MKFIESIKGRFEHKERKITQARDKPQTDGNAVHKKWINALKLERLYRAKRRNAPMEGQNVLVLGADYGFVCIEAVRQKAARVVFLGDAAPLDLSMMTGVEIYPPELSAVTDETFDAIFLPQAHTRPGLDKFLDQIAGLLNPKGVLVMESACNFSTQSIEWAVVGESSPQRRYPSIHLLETVLLRDFAVRRVGKGVLRNVDDIPQILLHCTPLAATALVITGRSGHGKSNLLRFFNPRDFPAISTDNFLSRLSKGKMLPDSSLRKAIQAEIGEGPSDWGQVGRMIADRPELIEEFCALLVDTCPLEAHIFIVEGEILRHDAILTHLTAHLSAKSVRVWTTTPSAM